MKFCNFPKYIKPSEKGITVSIWANVAGSLGSVSAVDSGEAYDLIADAHRDYGKRFIDVVWKILANEYKVG